MYRGETCLILIVSNLIARASELSPEQGEEA